MKCEIIQVTVDNHVLFWAPIAEDTRVKCSLPLRFFDNIPTRKGTEFVWDHKTMEIRPMEFDNSHLLEKFEKFESDWKQQQAIAKIQK